PGVTRKGGGTRERRGVERVACRAAVREMRPIDAVESYRHRTEGQSAVRQRDVLAPADFDGVCPRPAREPQDRVEGDRGALELEGVVATAALDLERGRRCAGNADALEEDVGRV